MNKKVSKIWRMDETTFPEGSGVEKKVKYLLKYAVLAPSSHNMQPWLYEIDGSILKAFLDPERRLVFSDRADRQAYISVGCSIANVLIAAHHFNMNFNYEVFPEDELEEVVARIKFTRKGNSSYLKQFKSLFQFIPKRCTNRFPHKSKNIDEEIKKELKTKLSKLGLRIDIIENKQKKNKIAGIVGEATEFAFSERMFKQELSKWVISVYSDRRDGIPLYDFGIPGPLTVFADKLIKLTPPKLQKAKDIKDIREACSVILLSSKNDMKEDWITSGIGYQVLSLLCTKHGLSLAPMGAAVEFGKTREGIAEIIGFEGYLMMFARLGYSERKSRHSPRRKVSRVLR